MGGREIVSYDGRASRFGKATGRFLGKAIHYTLKTAAEDTEDTEASYGPEDAFAIALQTGKMIKKAGKKVKGWMGWWFLVGS